MRRIKRGTAILILAVCLLLTAGCTTAMRGESDITKDKLVTVLNELLQHTSPNALTRDRELIGKRSMGADSYTGSYTADYREFDGEEILFGGTSLHRDGGNKLTVRYSLKITSGSASLYWMEQGTRHPITSGTTQGAYEINLSEGDNYVALSGSNFTGELSVIIE